MRFTCTPGPGWTSYCVTAGPGLTPTTLHSTPKVWRVLSMTLTFRLISSAIRSRRAVTVSRSVMDGSFHSISGRSSSGSATTRSAACAESGGGSSTATATGSAGGGFLSTRSSGSSTSQMLGWSGVAGAVAKLAAERVNRSLLAATGRAVFGFSAPGAATRSRILVRSAYAARNVPTAVARSAPGLKWMVTMRPITRPAMSRAQVPTVPTSPPMA